MTPDIKVPEKQHGPEAGTGEDGRSAVDFWSVDSAPRRFAGRVPQYKAPLLLALFTVFALAQMWLVNELPVMNAALPHNDYIFAPATGSHAIAVRIFMVSFFLAFGLTAGQGLRRKIGVVADLLSGFAITCFMTDVLAHIFAWKLNIVFSLHVLEIVSGLSGFAVFSFKLLNRGEMPARIRLRIDSMSTRRTATRLVIVIAVASGLARFVSAQDYWIVTALRDVALLGGIGPGVFLFLPLFFGLLYLGARVEAYLSPGAPFAPPLTVFVPAHNEAYIIERTISAMDAAAARYDGPVKLLVMNNNSTDETAALATAALARCTALAGEVIDVPAPGKANALNAGLDRVETEFCVRVDADTLLHPDTFQRAMCHFSDPKVGVVGGIPLPPGGGLFDRARFLEVAVKHAFYSVAFGTINAVVGIPGMLSIYRTHLPRDLGGFVEGMNGEDTDISLRAGELGYRLVVDPKVRYVSEVPATYRHMREQRMRWYRSTFHISARCRDLIFSRHATVRGKFMLPFMLVNSGRRAMTVPLMVYGVVEFVTDFQAFNTLPWQAVLAVAIGSPALMAAFAVLLLGRPRALLYLPEYIIFRVLRSYFTLESMLSITIGRKGEHIYSRPALARPGPPSPRIA